MLLSTKRYLLLLLLWFSLLRHSIVCLLSTTFSALTYQNAMLSLISIYFEYCAVHWSLSISFWLLCFLLILFYVAFGSLDLYKMWPFAKLHMLALAHSNIHMCLYVSRLLTITVKLWANCGNWNWKNEVSCWLSRFKSFWLNAE